MPEGPFTANLEAHFRGYWCSRVSKHNRQPRNTLMLSKWPTCSPYWFMSMSGARCWQIRRADCRLQGSLGLDVADLGKSFQCLEEAMQAKPAQGVGLQPDAIRRDVSVMFSSSRNLGLHIYSTWNKKLNWPELNCRFPGGVEHLNTPKGTFSAHHESTASRI